MEIEGEDGSKTRLNPGFRRELGRGMLGLASEDRTVSRRHVSLELLGGDDDDPNHPNSKRTVRFEVTGKNPVWVYDGQSGEIRVFRRGEEGEMGAGDMFCISAKKPLWFGLKIAELEVGKESELMESLENGGNLRKNVGDLELDSVGVSEIDPVKEFGFLVIGHEFDHYPKQKVHNAKSWDWFLEESKDNSDDNDKKGSRGTRRKRKKAEGNDDDEWTSESEDDKELVPELRKAQRPKYYTRSKGQNKTMKDPRAKKTSVQKKRVRSEEDEENEEDEEDDTLGSFIVKDDDVEEEEEELEEEEEEDYEEDEDEE